MVAPTPESPISTAQSPPSAATSPLSRPSPPTPPSPPLPPPLPSLSPADRPILARLFALNENYPALAAELAATASDRAFATQREALSPVPCASSPVPSDLLDLYAWASRPDIAPWIAFHRFAADNQRRSLALSTLESVIRSTDNPTERRRAASTLLRALDGRWSSLTPSPSSPSHRRSRSYAPPPAPISRPVPDSDPNSERLLLKQAFETPQASLALATIHAHAAENAFFAGYYIHDDRAEWVANTPDILPAGFRFPLILSECHETERTEVHSRWTCWATNTSKQSFRCTFSLIKNPNTNSRECVPDPCWRLATFDILKRSG